jgi:spermidine synthase
MTALGAEVIWTRILSLLFGATVYTFSLILAVFLLGLGIGSSIGSAIAGKIARPRLALGWCQMLLCVGMAWTAYMLTQSLPYWPINPSISSNPWYNFQLDVVRCLWAILPGTILWGAAFRLRWRPWHRAEKIRRDWLAASMPRTRSGQSSAPSPRASCWSSGSAASARSRCW